MFDMPDSALRKARHELGACSGKSAQEIRTRRCPVDTAFLAALGIAKYETAFERKVALIAAQDAEREHLSTCCREPLDHDRQRRIEAIGNDHDQRIRRDSLP